MPYIKSGRPQVVRRLNKLAKSWCFISARLETFLDKTTPLYITLRGSKRSLSFALGTILAYYAEYDIKLYEFWPKNTGFDTFVEERPEHPVD